MLSVSLSQCVIWFGQQDGFWDDPWIFQLAQISSCPSGANNPLKLEPHQPIQKRPSKYLIGKLFDFKSGQDCIWVIFCHLESSKTLSGLMQIQFPTWIELNSTLSLAALASLERTDLFYRKWRSDMGIGDGFPNTSRVLVEYGHSLIIRLSTGSGSENPSLWTGKDWQC